MIGTNEHSSGHWWQDPSRRPIVTVLAVGGFGLVCLLGLTLGLRGLSTSGSAPPPTASRSATGSAAAAANTSGFSSPSGNIRCLISAEQARCDIVQRSWQAPAKPASCAQKWGQGVSLNQQKSALVCSDSLLSGGPELAYGAEIERGPVSCTSSTTGISCSYRAGPRFTLARASYTLN